MTNLGTAMDSQYWDQPISTPRTLDGRGRSIPGDPFPLQACRGGRVLRIQQLSLLTHGFPLGIIPSCSSTVSTGPAPSSSSHPSFSFQSLLLRLASPSCWLGLVGEVRPKELIPQLTAELRKATQFLSDKYKAEELAFSDVKNALRNVAKPFLDSTHYSFGLTSQLSLPTSSSFLFTTERHGNQKRPRYKLMLFQKLPDHDITLEAAWPDLFIDRNGGYWEVPESISLDLSSLPPESGFAYRLGIHKNRGHPHSLNAVDCESPAALRPGVCGKAAFTYTKSKEIWRRKETIEDILMETDNGLFIRTSYDECLKEPHSTISGIVGGSCAAWFSGKESPKSARNDQQNLASTPMKRSPLTAGLFGSICYTIQYGGFRKPFGDLTRVDARLDICSASALGKRFLNALRKSAHTAADDPLSSPRLNLILQQQVAGPIVFRVDSRLALASSPEERGPHLEDIVYSLSYSLRLLHSGKVVAWYSPKRKEGMVELRLFEF